MNKKTVLITWASSWIWKSLSYLYIKKWFKVIAISRSEKKLEELEKYVWDKNLIIKSCDLTNNKDIDLLITFIKNKSLNIDILINNAWIWSFESFLDISKDEIKKIFNTNVLGHIFLTQSILKSFKVSNITFVSSLAWKIWFKNLSIYSSSKFAIEWFCDSLYEELIDKNIKVTIIRPWIVDTNFFDNTNFIDYANKIRSKMQSSNFVASEIYKAIKVWYKEYTIGNDKYFLFLQKLLPKFLHRKILYLFIN